MTSIKHPLSIPGPDDQFADWTDTQCVNSMFLTRRQRLDITNMTVPRVVKGLGRLGYEISVSDYKSLERHPYDHMDRIRGGILPLIYRVFMGDLPAYTNSDKHTQAVMKVLKDIREDRGYSYADVAKEISQRPGEQVTADEYRTMEQGITKNVPVSVVVRAAMVLNVRVGDLF